MKKYIEVNTLYARIALIILTLNFALTTYAIVKLTDQPAAGEPAAQEEQSTSQTPQTTEQTSLPSSD